MSVFAQSVSIGNGARMPLVGLGTWALRGRSGQAVIRRALDVGYRHLDTARVYRNEEEVGRAVRDSRIAREDVFITTKLPPDRAGRARETLSASSRLSTRSTWISGSSTGRRVGQRRRRPGARSWRLVARAGPERSG